MGNVGEVSIRYGGGQRLGSETRVLFETITQQVLHASLYPHHKRNTKQSLIGVPINTSESRLLGGRCSGRRSFVGCNKLSDDQRVVNLNGI